MENSKWLTGKYKSEWFTEFQELIKCTCIIMNSNNSSSIDFFNTINKIV